MIDESCHKGSRTPSEAVYLSELLKISSNRSRDCEHLTLIIRQLRFEANTLEKHSRRSNEVGQSA